MVACGDGEAVFVDEGESDSVRQNASSAGDLSDSCGYEIEHGTYSIWPGGYQAYGFVKNVSGETGLEFEVLMDVGDTTITNGWQAEYEEVEDGWSISEPYWLQWQQIPQGSSYQFGFLGAGEYEGAKAWIISINGEICDTEPPALSLSTNDDFFTADDTLTLTAEVSDNVAVRRVVFEQDGEVIAIDKESPYTLDLEVSEALNGRHTYTATAFDPTGNQGTDSVRVLVAINNKFLGTAPDSEADYEYLLDHFNQLTPENAGKWGSVEAVRDEPNWDDLDEAYDFAKDNGLPFKLHTLAWGQQQPSWIADLGPEEQLEEFEEWVAELAARYPDVDFVDAVNEPMHSKPSYAEALGGDGDTGYDWVITVFEMARQYFPNAELYVNDYNVLLVENFTQDYLDVIDILQQRGLVDGIGVQGHFLERIEASVISDNLDALAETGLPILVSEYDVDFADDARQAKVVSEQFPVFWDKAEMLGVTYWGHQEGSTWRPNAFLVRQDGTTRPALDFIQCYMAGGGESCTVPQYVPPGWQGGEAGLTLQAAQYDEGAGLVPFNDFVGFTDDGDWESYIDVAFQKNWDTFSVTYGKGNEDVGRISVYVDSWDNPVVSLELPPTAGWGTMETLSVPWPALSGEHDVFIEYEDVYGVGNVGSFRFGAPPGLGPNLVGNSDFEEDGSGWFSWNADTRTTSDEEAFTGGKSLELTDMTGNGAVGTDVTGGAVPGHTYRLSIWATTGGVDANLNVVQKLVCLNDAESPYSWVVNPTPVSPGEWVELGAEVKIPDECVLDQLQYYVEGASSGAVFLDHVSYREVPEEEVVNLVSNSDFEEDAGGWYTWVTTEVPTRTNALSHSGDFSLVLKNRTGNYPLATNLTGTLEPGGAYPVTFWVSIGVLDEADINLTQKIVCVDGDDDDTDPDEFYDWMGGSETVLNEQWTEFSRTLTVPETCDFLSATVYAEGGVGADLYVDDVAVLASVPPGNLLSDGDFESGSLGGWGTWDGSLGISDLAHSGSYSAINAGSSGSAPISHDLNGLVSPGETYFASFWVTIGGQASATVHLTRKDDCDDDDLQTQSAYSWVTDEVTVNEGEWVELSAEVTLLECPASLAIYAEKGSGEPVDLYIDDVVITK